MSTNVQRRIRALEAELRELRSRLNSERKLHAARLKRPVPNKALNRTFATLVNRNANRAAAWMREPVDVDSLYRPWTYRRRTSAKRR